MLDKRRYNDFWNWFKKNENLLYSDEGNSELFNELIDELKKANKDLTFQMDKYEQGKKRELVISCDGIVEHFKIVNDFVDIAPKLDDWKIVKFKQRSAIMNDFSLNGKLYKHEDVSYILFKDDEEVDEIGVALLFDHYKEQHDEEYAKVGFLFLDALLGEYDVATKVGPLIFCSREKFIEAKPISKLASEFDEAYAAIS